MSKKVNYATCPAPTLRLFHKVGAVETKPNKATSPAPKSLLRWSMSFQKTLKMTNKANLKIDQLNVTNVLTKDYNRLDTWYRGKNKANSKPICASPAPKSLVLWFNKASKIGIGYLKTE